MTETAIYPEEYPVPRGRTVSGRVAVPGSKSVTQRYFNLALLGDLKLVVHRPLLSEDPRLFLGALEACGFRVEHLAGSVRLEPGEAKTSGESSRGEIFCGNGGTMFRFLTAALATRPGRWRLDGIERLRERPVGPLVSALRQLGAEIECPVREGYAPLDITGGSLRGGRCSLDAGASSQYLSALLMAGLAAPEPVAIEVGALTSEPYVDLTLDAVAELGGDVRRDGDVFHVAPSRLSAPGGEVTVEADFSAVAYPAAAAMLTGGTVLIEGPRPDSRQGDRRFVDLLEQMGAEVRWHREGLEVTAGSLHAVEADLSGTPDQVPTLAALAPFASGTTRITGVPHLRIKESDRLSAMAQELTRVGAEVEELADGLVIRGVWARSDPPATPVSVRSHGDHRIAMSMALVGLRRPGVTVREPGVVVKSYPEFWTHLEKLTGGPGPPDGGGREDERRDGEAEEPALLHPALERDEGVTLDQARLTDQQRLGVVLQGAALLAHLEHGGWFLPAGWDDARLTADAVLRAAAIRRGSSGQLAQVVLQQLLRRLFHTEGNVAGRGAARRAARHLLGRWQQVLVPSSPDRALAEILEAAPFLWGSAFAAMREGLVAEHVSSGRSHLWLAGPGPARNRFLSGAGTRREVEALLAGPRARDLWEGWRPGVDAVELAAKGRWRQAAVAWRRQPPETSAEARARGRCLIALGRYSQALEALRGQRHLEARLLRARAQVYVGELNAAHATIRRLSEASLSPAQTVELAEVAIRLFGKRGQRREIEDWAARALAASRGKLRLEAAIVAAGGAWDCDDMAAMDRYLEESRDAVDEPDLAGRWHHARGLRAIKAPDGPSAVEHIGAALAHDRRRLSKVQAGRLWNDLALGRALADDLAGAERAALHALRLLGDSEDPGRTTLALYNLAEVRLRRGRCAGVEQVLDLSTAENRRAGNLRGLMQDLELWVRLELAQGRAAAALAHSTEALLRLDRDGITERRGIFETLAARAHGWSGRRQEAAACLERAGGGCLDELESEERPALLALAGDLDAACEVAAGTRWAELWKALAAGAHPPPRTWDELRSLEPFRAARLIFDCELTLPGVAPPRRLRQAVAALRRCGAEALAENLENRSSSPWRALESYAAQGGDAKAIEDLFADAGYDDVRLSWIRHAREEILISGSGGDQELSGTTADGGRLVLRAQHVDGVLRTFFALVRRDFRPPTRRESRAAAGRELVGESAVLRRAVERLDRLAVGDLPVLILGESGTGKELMARRVHHVSRRAEGPLLPVNSAALPDTLIESVLFGHVKGSFTGADRDRPGVFESARSGTVFLDEIGDLPGNAQAKLLRVLQEGEVQRVGESFARKVDVRVVTATHRDLEEMISRGEFRRDLFFRLNAATIELPPLRERGRDVLLLADHFLANHRDSGGLSKSARARLLSYRWPGNVRELKNVLDVAVAMAPGREIQTDDLDLPATDSGPKGDYHQMVEQYRKNLIAEALAQAEGNRAAAGRRLGLTRQAMSYLVKQLGLS